MSRKILLPVTLVIALLLFGCNMPGAVSPTAQPSATLSVSPTDTTAPATVPPATLAASETPLPTNTPVPSSTSAPVATNTTVSLPVPVPAGYTDDRSTPSQVIVSFYNAINRQEYSRAYGYYNDPATQLGNFTTWANGYLNTASVDLVFGQISGDAGMSQVYYSVPVLLKTTAKNNTKANFAACYVVHEVQQDVLGAPPAMPMGIDRGAAKVSDVNASDASALSTACSDFPAGPMQVPVSANSLSIDKTNFLDNRSGPIETVSSFLNALNHKQYVRAYSYFQAPASYPGPYSPYAAGYANTDTITVTFGAVQSEGAAGSTYYKVPLAELVQTTSHTTQTFVGCYTLRLAQPGIQTAPPFQPMGITAGKFTQVANGTNVTALLPAACN